MRKKSFFRELTKTMRLWVDQLIPDVNNGGCGVVAAALYDQLKELGMNPKIIVLGTDWAHVMVKVGRLYLDSTGVYAIGSDQLLDNARKTYITYHTKSPLVFHTVREQLENDINDRRLWNPTYDRRLMPKTMRNVKHAVNEALANINS